MRSTNTLSARAEKSIYKNGLGGRISQYRHKQIIYSQGGTANTIFCVREGGVLLTVRLKGRRTAAIAVVGAGDFFGHSCLAGGPLRRCTATAIGSCSILIIERKEMIRTLRSDPVTSQMFVSYLLSVITKHQEHLVDLLVNSTEQRLAHVLVELGQLSTNGGRIPKISQEVLANMVGTTRGRVNLYISRFRRRGFITCKEGITVRGSLRAAYLLP